MTWELMKKELEKAADLGQKLDGVSKKDTLIGLVHETFWRDDDDASNDEAPEEWWGVEKAEHVLGKEELAQLHG